MEVQASSSCVITSMVPQQHEQVSGSSEADRGDRYVSVRRFLIFEIQRGPEPSAVRSGRPGVDKASVCSHHQQAVHESKGATLLLLPTLAKHVPSACDGVHPEEP